MKRCSNCFDFKDLSYFNKKTKSKDGYRSECKMCQKLNYENNKVYYIQKMKENRLNKLNEYVTRDAEYYKNNKEKILLQKKNYGLVNKNRIGLMKKKYRKNNLNKIREDNKQWVIKNIDRVREYRRNYSKEYRRNYPHVVTWRSLLGCSLKRLGQSKEGHTIDLLGYSALELKNHITNLFTEGMSWDNHGEWHIDHIKDISTFNQDTHPSIVNALSNLRPLWATTRDINGVVYEGNLNRNKVFKKDILDGSIKK